MPTNVMLVGAGCSGAQTRGTRQKRPLGVGCPGPILGLETRL
jgi:hypothetical protein